MDIRVQGVEVGLRKTEVPPPRGLVGLSHHHRKRGGATV